MTPDSDFNPEAFLASAVVDGELSTQTLNCPEGRYRAQVGDRIDARQVDTKNGVRTIVRVPWMILDDAVKAELERDTVIVTQDLWLDLDENGALDTGKGKNVDLGRVREAVGQNNLPGWTFPSLRGQMAMVQVAHRSDTTNPERKYAEIRRITKLD